jgi:hypothetical protein
MKNKCNKLSIIYLLSSAKKIFIGGRDKEKGGVKIEELLLFSSIVIAGLSFLLFFISAVSFKRIREIKLLFISIALLLFFLKSIIAIVENLANPLIFIDLIIIVMLYLAAARK